MDLNLIPKSSFSILILFWILIHAPNSDCQDNQQFLTCGAPFRCSNFPNINYPFWGDGRPDYCGHPQFQLSCRGDAPIINITNVPYRVLSIDGRGQRFTVARDDLRSDLCPRFLRNSTFDSSIFSYGSGEQNLTIHYGCTRLPGLTQPIPNQFDCLVNETNSASYFMMRDTPIFNISTVTCRNRVLIPVNETSVQALLNPTASVTNLREAISGGFELRWTANDTDCRECDQSGGQCGTDSGSFACHCVDRTYPIVCRSNQTRNGSGNNNQISLGLAFGLGGAVFAGVGIGWLIFFYRQRRKRRSAGQTGTKDVQTPPPPPPAAASSKGLSSSSSSSFIHFNRSIPSYASSKSEFGNSTYYGVPVFSYAELEEATDNFDSSRELGDGGFGTVYYGKLNDGRVVAVKRLYENNFKRKEQFMNEIEILTRLRHRNLVALFGCTSKRSHELLLVYEFIPNGTVADHVHGKLSNSGLLSWPVRLNIAIETAGALSYLHASDIIHRDVKTNNILLDNDFHVKVADFGLSRLFPTDVTHVSTAPQGTPGYVDPEYYRCYQLTEKSDVYSFGVFLIELVSSLPAVDTNRHRHEINLSNMAINKIQNHGLHELVDPKLGFGTDDWVRRTVTAVAELAFRCLQPEKDMRPSMEEVAAGLRGIQNEKVNDQEFDVVDILDDDVALLKSNSLPPLLLESMAVGDN